jgi:hypothetical protein
MICDEFETRIQSLLDCRVLPGDDQLLREHAQQCPDCAAVLDAYTAMLDSVEIHETPELDDEFSQRVVQLAFPPQASKPARSRSATRMMILALVSVAALVMISVLPRLRMPKGPTPSPGGSAGRAGTIQIAGPGPSVKQTEPPVTSEDPDRLTPANPDWRVLWTELSDRLASEDLQPIETLAKGIRPITNSLTTAVDGLRTTFPVGGIAPTPEPSKDSASLPATQPEFAV